MVVHHDLRSQAGLPGVLHEHFGLPRDPGFVGMSRRRRGKHAPCLDVQKHEHEQIPKPVGVSRFLGEEVALPKRGGVQLQKSSHVPGTALGTDVEAVLLEKILYRASRHRFNPQLLQFRRGCGYNPSCCLLGQLRISLPISSAVRRRPGLLLVRFGLLAASRIQRAQRIRMHDRHQFVQPPRPAAPSRVNRPFLAE